MAGATVRLPRIDATNAAYAADNKILAAQVESLKAEIESLKARHEAELKLKEAETRVELQPALKESYDKGYDACKKAFSDAKEFMRSAGGY